MCCLGFACQAVVQSTLVHFGARGAPNDVLADFTKLIIFMTKVIQDQELYAFIEKAERCNVLFKEKLKI